MRQKKNHLVLWFPFFTQWWIKTERQGGGWESRSRNLYFGLFAVFGASAWGPRLWSKNNGGGGERERERGEGGPLDSALLPLKVKQQCCPTSVSEILPA